ncbi:MAG: ATP-dependent Clp protease adapter ClpS [Deltaproteobacteria bacterium]|nr:ATP-dependent Clp protease adapter ClpS [Deltaproteobacteria bacterium]
MSNDSPSRIPEGDTLTQVKPKLKKPPLYRVSLLNDDYTTMEFVIQVLQKFFQKSFEEATQIMLQVHHKGQAACGFYPFEIAETKVNQVISFSRTHEHPLQCIMEEA